MATKPCILLTGISGFVGSHLAPVLTERFPHHCRVSICHSGSRTYPGWHLEAADIADEGAVDAIVRQYQPEMVIHLAAQSSVGQSISTEKTWRVNFSGSFALAKAVVRHAPGALFLFTSSSEVYGHSFRLGTATEDTPPAPAGAYAASKLSAELMFHDVLPPSSRLIVARPFNHTGPGQDERFVLPSFTAQIARIEAGLCEPRLLVGNIAAERDFLHVADVVDAYLRLLEKASTLPPRALFNIASGQAFRIEELLGRLRELAKVQFSIEVDPNRVRHLDIPRAAGDTDRLRSATGWKPKHSMAELLSELLNWWRARVE